MTSKSTLKGNIIDYDTYFIFSYAKLQQQYRRRKYKIGIGIWRHLVKRSNVPTSQTIIRGIDIQRYFKWNTIQN